MNMQNKKDCCGLIMEDKIGKLPDDVIGVVLSNLTVKEARRTSVLSRRWKNMWTLTTRLNFDASERLHQFVFSRYVNREWYKGATERERREYIRQVNQFVDNHGGTDLDEFVVVFHLDARHTLHLDEWISFAVKKRVKVIKIDLSAFFIEEGKVRYSFMRSAPVLPGIECLSSLDLKFVNITGEMIEHLLLVCPQLERLRLVLTEDLSYLRIVGPSLKLKYLAIFLRHHLASIEIRAPNLVSLHYCVPNPTKLRLDQGLSCLHDLYTNDSSLDDDIVQLWHYLSRLETLKLAIHSDYGVLGLLVHGIQYKNLKHLTIQIMHFPPMFYTSVFTNVINLCPLLRKFTLELSQELFEVELLSNCCNSFLHQNLKVVEMTRFIGLNHEIGIAKYFLTRARGLEKLIIDAHCTLFSYEGVSPAAVPAGSRERAETLRNEVPNGIELLIL